MGIVGEPKDVDNFANSVEIDELANFAVDQYRTRQVFIQTRNFNRAMSGCNLDIGVEFRVLW